MRTRRLAVVSAGLSEPSSTRLLADRLRAATEAALRDEGIESSVSMIELRDHAHEVTNNLLTGFPSGQLPGAIKAVAEADGLIAVTPTFNASYSGLFKSFFDILDAGSLIGMPVLIAATGGTARHSLALEHALRPMFTYLRSVVAPTAVFAAPEDWGGDARTGVDWAGEDRAGEGQGGEGRAGAGWRGEGRAGGVEGRAGGVEGRALKGRIDQAARELAGLMRLRSADRPADPFDEPTPFERLLAGDP